MMSIYWSILKYVQHQYSKSIKCMHLNKTSQSKGQVLEQNFTQKRACKIRKRLKIDYIGSSLFSGCFVMKMNFVGLVVFLDLSFLTFYLFIPI